MLKLLARWADIRPTKLAVFNFYVCRWSGWRLARCYDDDGNPGRWALMRWPNRRWGEAPTKAKPLT